MMAFGKICRLRVWGMLCLTMLIASTSITTSVHAQSYDPATVFYMKLMERGWTPMGPENRVFQSPDGYCRAAIGERANFYAKPEETFEAMFNLHIIYTNANPGTNIVPENDLNRMVMKDGTNILWKKYTGKLRQVEGSGSLFWAYKNGVGQEFSEQKVFLCGESTALNAISAIGGGEAQPNTKSECEEECSKDYAFCTTQQFSPMNCAGKLRACQNACR
jgi:hypothetical protein